MRTDLEPYFIDLSRQLNHLESSLALVRTDSKNLGIAGERLLVFKVDQSKLVEILERCQRERDFSLKFGSPLDYLYSPPQEEKGTLRCAAHAV